MPGRGDRRLRRAGRRFPPGGGGGRTHGRRPRGRGATRPVPRGPHRRRGGGPHRGPPRAVVGRSALMAEGAPRRVSTLTPEERQRLEAKLLAGGPAAWSALPRRDPAAPVPLSPTQQRLWFLHQLVPDSVAYHIPLAARLNGPLDVEALRRSFELIVHRHEALRTGIVVEADEPHQKIAPVGPFALPV